MAYLKPHSKFVDIITKIMIAGGLAIIVWVLWPFAGPGAQNPIPPANTPAAENLQPSKPPISVGVPVRIQIPAIGVDAAVQPVGLTGEGAMGVPDNLSDVSWYQKGVKPGEAGQAVIAGHTSSRGWVPAVFDDLDKLKVGDQIIVVDELGKRISFAVRESRIYDAEANPAEIYAGSSQAHLNLITCTGKFNVLTQSFPQRLVIFSDAQF